MATITVKQILDLAESQIGTTEYPPNSNNVKYNTAYYGRAVNGATAYPWCMVFIWWLFYALSASKLLYDGARIAGCTTFMRWAKQQKGQWVTSGYKPGDIVLYDFDGNRNDADHCGIVVSTTKTGVYAIEGNTSSSGSQDNGGAVLKKARPNTVILGAFRPAYSNTGEIGQKVEEVFNLATLKTLQKGSAGREVRALQILLVGNGYSVGPYGYDGDFGANTETALKRYQEKNGLTVDGICGPKTWAKILGK